ncbi:hypothetical protein WH47_10529 [Habropoda laboriosa]|uniref:DUF7041 domain-containing protein n=1 Tax=Habropoda laboriosa TaxID=597456 RepID=A0A0L7QMU1_9HYME|nr:hypothetical protein WH47_10529 [Habropoda laboriosa]
MATHDEPTVTPQVNKISIRVPPFWPEQPAVWFKQLEAQFQLNGITADSTKFYHTISQLENKYAVEVHDVICNPPERERYETIKQELIHRVSTSQTRKIHQLLEKEEIGDRTPSQFLRHIKTLAGDTVSEEFLRTLWSSRLPATTQAIVSPPPQVAAVANQTPDPMQQRLEKMEFQIAELTNLLRRQQVAGTSKRRSRSRSRNRSRSPATKGYCWYHLTFGARSTKCKEPCTYTSGNEASRN